MDNNNKYQATHDIVAVFLQPVQFVSVAAMPRTANQASAPEPPHTVAPTTEPSLPAPTATLAVPDTAAPAASTTTTLAVGSAKEQPKWTDDFLKPSNPLDCEDY